VPSRKGRLQKNSSPLRGLKPLAQFGANPKVPRLDYPTVAPRGPKLYKLAARPRILGVGPGEPPPGFVTAHTSASEWRYYWALSRVLGTPRNPRIGPFTGGVDWSYQKAIEGGRMEPGGSVVDFVVHQGTSTMGIRIQTERFHVFADAATQMKDLSTKIHVKALDKIIDIYDQWSIADRTGEATIKQVKRALQGIQEQDPLRFGTAQRKRAIK